MKQIQATRRPNRRQRIYVAMLTALIATSLLFMRSLLAQDGTNTGPIQINAGTTFYSAGQLTNNASGAFTNAGNVVVAGSLNFQNGTISEPLSGIVTFRDDATTTNAGDASHVDGLVRKIGNDAFTFPLGDGGRYGPLGISAPANATDQIDARYWLANPQSDAGTTLGVGITSVSSIEYWNVSGAVTVNLTLHWDSNSGVAGLSNGNLANLRVVGWNGAQWLDLGNAGVTGTAAAGTITANGIIPNSYQAYTLGTVYAPTPGIEYALRYNSTTNRYEVWLRPTYTPGAPNQTVTAQVTIKAPHVAGSGAFTPTSTLAYTATLWTVDSVVRSPSEAAGYDYLSFGLNFPTGNTGAFAWQAGVERLAFSFQNGGVCSGPVTLMANNDGFNVYPNSAGTNPGNAIDVLTLGNDPGNDFLGDYSSGAAVCPVASSVTLPVKLFLQGPYLQAAGMMTDTLRSKGLVPTSSPYTATATTTAGVLAVTGNNAIVDWVLVEVRDSATPATVVARQSALLQRDGDVVAVNGTSTLTFTLSAGNYHVALKHRNHLGAMTINPVALSAATPRVDFTASAGYGTYGQATVGGVYALWMGNTSGDQRVIGAGPSNDRNAILAEALSAPGNANHNANYIVTAYSNGDVNLDGRVIAAGPGNDINYILYNVFVHPGNGSAAANFVVQGQAP